MRSILVLLALALVAAGPFAQAPTANALTVYVVDVEGGNATLLVAPSGESLLIDTGNPGARDTDRIAAAANDAGVTQIDYLITTHYHSDHVGGAAELTARLPIRRFIDHGPTVESGPAAERLYSRYEELASKAARTVVQPGDRVAVRGLDVRVVTSAGQAINKALAGGGKPNPLCGSFTPKAADTGENAQSVGVVVTFGGFKMAHLGDLTWNKEFELMCPVNPIGGVDLLMVSHHGLNVSNSGALVHALQPRVAVMNNGIRKGGPPETMQTLYASAGLEDVWQLHFSLLGGQEFAAPGLFIANPLPDATVPVAPSTGRAGGPGGAPPATHDGQAYWIKIAAQSNGTFAVTNSRNGFTKTYR